MFDKNFVLKYYKNKEITNQFALYFIYTKDLIDDIQEEKYYKGNIPKTDLYYLIQNI